MNTNQQFPPDYCAAIAPTAMAARPAAPIIIIVITITATRVNAALPGPTQTFHCARRGNLTQHFWPNADLSLRTPGFSRPHAKTPRTPRGTLPGTRCREQICCARRGNAALRPKRHIDTRDSINNYQQLATIINK